MALLSQTNFPRLWDWFQYCIGGTVDKHRICSLGIRGDERVLEIGCSTGNIAAAFAALPSVKYTGLDIDATAIMRAKAKFTRFPNLRFSTQSFLEVQPAGGLYDVILFAGVLHHVDDALVTRFMNHAPTLLRPGGKIVVVDPVLPHTVDPRIFTQFLALEQGQFVRSSNHLRQLLAPTGNVKLAKEDSHLVACTPWGWPRVCRFARYELTA